jgi:MFS family permease
VVVERQPDFQEPLVSFLKRSASFTVPLLASLVLLNLYANGYLVWLAPYFTRTHGWELAKVGRYLGITVLSAGIVGSLLGGWVTSAVTRRLQRDAAMLVSVIAVALLAPLAIFTPLAPNGEIAMVLVGLQLTLAFGATATLPAVLVTTSPAHLRARFFGTNLFLGQLIGAGLGATIFAVITDHLLHDEKKLYLSLAIGATAIFVPLLGLLWRASNQYQSALSRVEQSGEAATEARSQEGAACGKLQLVKGG